MFNVRNHPHPSPLPGYRQRGTDQSLRSRLLLFALIMLASATVAAAADFSRDAAPRKCSEPLVPEGLPALEHPNYYNSLDKAKADVFSGRYKLALQTLRSV